MWCGRPGPALLRALAVAGTAGFLCAIAMHFWVGYTDMLHLAPAVAGAAQFAIGLVLSARRMLA